MLTSNPTDNNNKNSVSEQQTKAPIKEKKMPRERERSEFDPCAFGIVKHTQEREYTYESEANNNWRLGWLWSSNSI